MIVSCNCCNPLETVEGWKEIAAAVGKVERTAMDYAKRNVDPLPVWKGPEGVWAYKSAIRDWVARNKFVPYQQVQTREADPRARPRARGASPAATSAPAPAAA